MRKLTLLSAALLPLLAGCVSNTCDYPTATIHWRLTDTAGTNWGCGAAGVASIDVYIGDAQPLRFPCLDYGVVIDTSRFAPGTYPTTLEGIGADGLIYDRAQFDLAVSDCGDRQYYPVLGEATLTIDYHFAPDVCHGGYMWFSLYDEVAFGPIASVNFDTLPASWKSHYGCWDSANNGTPIQFSVPYGSYTLAWIQEVMNPQAALAADVTPVQQACAQPTIAISGAGNVNLPVTLSSSVSTTCAPYP
jgi:hypothetical protein